MGLPDGYNEFKFYKKLYIYIYVNINVHKFWFTKWYKK